MEDRVESLLWPFVEHVAGSWAVPGLSVCVVHDGDRVTARGFGTRDSTTGAPVTTDTVFHLASVSKTVVATGVLGLVEAGALDLDGRVAGYLPDLPWADPRAHAVTVRHLLCHCSGIGDVDDYGWQDPQLDDDALGRFAAAVATWPLAADPGERFAYSNSAYELLGHLLATIAAQPFEAAVKERVLEPAGLLTSTFRPGEVPAGLRARPHLGLPPRVVPGAYPYTRPHAPSSSLHSSAADMGRWMVRHLAGGDGLLARPTHELMWRAVSPTGWDERHAETALGWFRGTYRGESLVGHSGSDPGFEADLVLVPDRGIGVSVLVAGNTAPMLSLARAALDVLLGHRTAPAPAPPATVPLAPVLESAGASAAVDLYRRLAKEDPATVDLGGDGGFADAVWGLVELHRTDLAAPLLELWHRVQPTSSPAAFMSGWAAAVDGRTDDAVRHLRRAVALDPDNDDALAMLSRIRGG